MRPVEPQRLGRVIRVDGAAVDDGAHGGCVEHAAALNRLVCADGHRHNPVGEQPGIAEVAGREKADRSVALDRGIGIESQHTVEHIEIGVDRDRPVVLEGAVDDQRAPVAGDHQIARQVDPIKMMVIRMGDDLAAVARVQLATDRCSAAPQQQLGAVVCPGQPATALIQRAVEQQPISERIVRDHGPVVDERAKQTPRAMDGVPRAVCHSVVRVDAQGCVIRAGRAVELNQATAGDQRVGVEEQCPVEDRCVRIHKDRAVVRQVAQDRVLVRPDRQHRVRVADRQVVDAPVVRCEHGVWARQPEHDLHHRRVGRHPCIPLQVLIPVPINRAEPGSDLRPSG